MSSLYKEQNPTRAMHDIKIQMPRSLLTLLPSPVKPHIPKCMLERLKGRHTIRVCITHIVLQHTTGIRMLQRPTKEQPRLRRKQQLEMLPLRAGAEKHRVLRDVRESLWVTEDRDVQPRQERFVKRIEDGVLRVDFEWRSRGRYLTSANHLNNGADEPKACAACRRKHTLYLILNTDKRSKLI